MVIIANSVILAMEDPTSSKQSGFFMMLDDIFLGLYTVEMVLKILGMGFVFNKGAYLRDYWNLLDFVIVATGYLSLILAGGGTNFTALRSFRVLRPLRTISGIEGLRVIMQALITSLPLLRDTIIVLLFFFIIFAIAGVQLFSGMLKKRCVNIETGIVDPKIEFCGTVECPPGFFCGKTNMNPNFGQTNFDTVFYSLIAVFQSVTLEGWSVLMLWI